MEFWQESENPNFGFGWESWVTAGFNDAHKSLFWEGSKWACAKLDYQVPKHLMLHCKYR